MDDNRTTRRLGATAAACLFVLCVVLMPARAGAQPPEAWCCEGIVGDVDQTGVPDITDISILIDNQFLTLTPLPCWGNADLDSSLSIDITDLQRLIDFMFFCDGMGPGGSCFFYCPSPPPSGTMEPLTGCKTEGTAAASESADQSCIAWEYDGESQLVIRHINAGLNCCPEGQAEVTVSEGVITVDETTIDGLCDCLCLFDVSFLVVSLPPGEYTIVVDEPLWSEPGEMFEFTVDLNASPTGMVCTDRNRYPWGTY